MITYKWNDNARALVLEEDSTSLNLKNNSKRNNILTILAIVFDVLSIAFTIVSLCEPTTAFLNVALPIDISLFKLLPIGAAAL